MKSSKKRDDALESYPNRRSYETFADFKDGFDGTTQMATYEFMDLPIDFLFASNPAQQRLAVFFNSQQRPDSLKLFTWQKVARSFSAHRLFITDPLVSVNESLNLGWYVGSRNANLQQHFKQFIQHIAQICGLNEIIFFGSSGGGYPAIYYSQMFDDSIAVTLAPTTTILHHSNKKLVKNWEAASESSPNIPVKPEELSDNLELDLPSLFSNGLKNPVIILQNSDDNDFIQTQTNPLAASQGLILSGHSLDSDKLHIRLESYGDGHRPPPSDRVTELATRISEIPLGELKNASYSAVLDG